MLALLKFLWSTNTHFLFLRIQTKLRKPILDKITLSLFLISHGLCQWSSVSSSFLSLQLLQKLFLTKSFHISIHNKNPNNLIKNTRRVLLWILSRYQVPGLHSFTHIALLMWNTDIVMPVSETADLYLIPAPIYP